MSKNKKEQVYVYPFLALLTMKGSKTSKWN